MQKYQNYMINYKDGIPHYMKATSINELRKKLFQKLIGTSDAVDVYIETSYYYKHLGTLQMVRSVVEPRAYWRTEKNVSSVDPKTGKLMR